MRMHPEEYAAAQSYWKDRPFPNLTDEQYARIKENGKRLIRFHLRHPGRHHAVNFCALVFLFAADALILLKLGGVIPAGPVVRGIVIGALHAVVMYFLLVFTLHEGAAHKLIILPHGRLSRAAAGFVNQLARITFAEPAYYAKNHLSHHAHFTTAQDDEFLNFISAKRFGGVFLPFADALNTCDFKSHAEMSYTIPRKLSIFLTVLYHGAFAWAMTRHYSWITIVIALVIVYPHLFFWLDRLRQYMEHNLMPLNAIDGARDLGLDIWGMLIGGGPWGQPCHWTHHLYPGIPWYNQLRLHLIIGKILTAEQRKKFFLQPVVGFPRVLWRTIRATKL